MNPVVWGGVGWVVVPSGLRGLGDGDPHPPVRAPAGEEAWKICPGPGISSAPAAEWVTPTGRTGWGLRVAAS